MPSQYTPDLLFPNKIIYAWTYEGMYYAITADFRVFSSSNKFSYSSSGIGELPGGWGMVELSSPTGKVTLELSPLPSGGGVQETVTNVLVKGNVILVEYVHGEYGPRAVLTKDFGISWVELTNLIKETPGHLSRYEETTNIWRGGVSAFMCTDERGCNTYIFKPMFQQRDDDTYHMSGWLVVNDQDVVIHDSSDATKDKLTVERRFPYNGELIDHYDNKLNTMDGHHEKYRKPYTLRWPQFIEGQNPPESIDRNGFLVNPFDVVMYRNDDKYHWIITLQNEIRIKTGLLAENENKYLPDLITTRVPITYVVDVNTLRDATLENKAFIRVLDLVGFDTYLAPLHKAQVTTRTGVYSFIQNLIGKAAPLFNTYGTPGTVYSYNAPTGETFPSRVNIDRFKELCSGDLMKITDPEFGRDVVAFLSRDRVKVCISDPSKEYNWIDKTSVSTFARSTQRIKTRASVAVLTDDTNSSRTMNADVWSGYDTVLRYDYENNRLLGYPIYGITQDTEADANLIGYNFPAVIRISANNYTIGYATSGGLEYKETNITRQFNLNEDPTDIYTNLYYGGFVGDTRGYIGSLTKFVNGILVPPEPEIPTQPVPNPPSSPNPPLAAPTTIALLDDITHSTSAVIASNRRAVEFGLSRGSAIANISVNSSKWYIELNSITTSNLHFGIAKAGFDVDKEPGDDDSVVAVGIDGSVIRGGTMVYRTSSPLIDFAAGGSPTIGIVIDMDNRILQFTNGEGNYFSQAIGGLPTGSLTLFLGATANTADTTSTSVAVNFGQLPFKYTVPNGVHRGYGIA